MAPSDGKARALARAHRKQAANAGKQFAAIAENTTDVMGALLSNVLRKDEPTSALSNPAKSTAQVKHDYAYDLRERAKQHLQVLRTHIEADLTPGLVQLAAQLPKVSLDALRDTLLGVRNELAALTVGVGLQRSHGWELSRLTDFWMMAAKGVVLRAQTVILQRAPALLTNVTAEQLTASVSQETLKDAKIILTRDEIHRLSNHYGLDAKTLSLLLKDLASIRAEGKVEIAALGDVTISSKDGIDLATANTLKSSAKMHSICDMAGGTIKVTNGVIDLNPLGIPTAPTLPVVVLPVVLADGSKGEMAGIQVVPQYEGMAGQGTSFA
jgi:hypothetical protein